MRHMVLAIALLLAASAVQAQSQLTLGPIPSPLVSEYTTETRENCYDVAQAVLRVWKWDGRKSDGCTSYVLTLINSSGLSAAIKNALSQIVALWGPVDPVQLYIRLTLPSYRRSMILAAADAADKEGLRLIALGTHLRAWSTAMRQDATTVTLFVVIPRE